MKNTKFVLKGDREYVKFRRCFRKPWATEDENEFVKCKDRQPSREGIYKARGRRESTIKGY